MTGNLSAASNARHILLLLLADLVISLSLAALRARRLAILWIERKKGRAGSRRHGRLVALFSVRAVAPTTLVAPLSVILFDLGLDVWVRARGFTALKHTRPIPAAYPDPHRNSAWE